MTRSNIFLQQQFRNFFRTFFHVLGEVKFGAWCSQSLNAICPIGTLVNTLLYCFLNVLCTVIIFLTIFCTVFTPFFAPFFLPLFNRSLRHTDTAIKTRAIVKRNGNEHGTQNYRCKVACFEKRELFVTHTVLYVNMHVFTCMCSLFTYVFC